MSKKYLNSLVMAAMLVSTSSTVWADGANQAALKQAKSDKSAAVVAVEKTDAKKQVATKYQKAGMAAGQTQASNQGIGILNTPAIIGIAAVAATIGIALQAASDDDAGGTGTGTSTSGT